MTPEQLSKILNDAAIEVKSWPNWMQKLENRERQPAGNKIPKYVTPEDVCPGSTVDKILYEMYKKKNLVDYLCHWKLSENCYYTGCGVTYPSRIVGGRFCPFCGSTVEITAV